MDGAGRTLAAPGHNNVWMRAKMNRYDLSLWDAGKRSLYGRKTESVQAATRAGGSPWLSSRASVLCAARDLGEPREASRFLRRNKRAFGSLPY
jgi:hypothetical protein